MIRIRWEIDVDADTPEEAALKALDIQRDPESIALVFHIITGKGKPHSVDLMEYAVCDNCGHMIYLGDVQNRLAEINNLFHRIEPGGVIPACECASCGALAYPVRRTG